MTQPHRSRPPRVRAIFSEPLARHDGASYSARYGDVYASRAGALEQARSVFLQGSGLPERWRDQGQFVVLEVGFGLGINFLATWKAWREDPQRPARLHFVSIELHPVLREDLLAAAPAELRELAQAVRAQWPLPLAGLHRLSFDDGRVTLTLALGDAGHLLRQLQLGADALYLDGFAPDRNPEPWSAATLKALARIARPGATAATWCVAGTVRDGLAAAGFEVERAAGFGGKRQRLVARFAPRWKVRRRDPPVAYGGPRHALVIGAGLAGCSVAAALAGEGWRVDLLERHAQPAAESSALPAGLLHPQITPDDSVLARLARAGFLRSVRWLDEVPPDARAMRRTGVLQVVPEEADRQSMQRALAQLNVPSEYARWLDAPAAAAATGSSVRHGGLWFEQAGVVDAGAWCRALLGRHAARVRLRAGVQVQSLQRDGNGWRAVWTGGEATAPVVVVASSMDAARLLGWQPNSLRAVRGRLTLLDRESLRDVRAALAGDGYLVPEAPRGGFAAVGASYELDAAAGVEVDDLLLVHAGNLARLQRLLQQPPQVMPVGVFDGLRCVSRDRLPMAGAVLDAAAAGRMGGAGLHLADLPRQPGLYCLTALGSRGLTLAPLLAELIVAMIEGAPLPLEGDLAAAVDPARFDLQRLRRGRA